MLASPCSPCALLTRQPDPTAASSVRRWPRWLLLTPRPVRRSWFPQLRTVLHLLMHSLRMAMRLNPSPMPPYFKTAGASLHASSVCLCRERVEGYVHCGI
ncbi:hypothetical protein B0H10DRAFT_2066551 [Mycena sp. CBHHK59/15]|nr:hypothetical protein B0H10DRAFT_2083365 [Mycena sp. CBHHK59/15]KAJ6607102.1 hypothetical protein B0H10DRAFT_2073145 [Mycena sp. CBHHK59/15]KAJ6608775.1 hypothetical protein B0H10DRAFT_2066551 [Mycena sp. CBHHK59/15]